MSMLSSVDRLSTTIASIGTVDASTERTQSERKWPALKLTMMTEIGFIASSFGIALSYKNHE
ncbi:hypothetical protein [Methylocaldum gracile]|uniref:hypothetical protein n=1 Tax=Methylocaldum sp. 0917 TaxID=2485163 RepID=UPI001B48333B